jgi:hypothetical protein
VLLRLGDSRAPAGSRQRRAVAVFGCASSHSALQTSVPKPVRPRKLTFKERRELERMEKSQPARKLGYCAAKAEVTRLSEPLTGVSCGSLLRCRRLRIVAARPRAAHTAEAGVAKTRQWCEVE